MKKVLSWFINLCALWIILCCAWDCLSSSATLPSFSSNLIAYIGRANLSLSVVSTAVSTILGIVMTPFLTKVLASGYVPVDVWGMLRSDSGEIFGTREGNVTPSPTVRCTFTVN